jgi:hypothetical protein
MTDLRPGDSIEVVVGDRAVTKTIDSVGYRRSPTAGTVLEVEFMRGDSVTLPTDEDSTAGIPVRDEREDVPDTCPRCAGVIDVSLGGARCRECDWTPAAGE